MKYIILLRGVNIGGRKVKSAELKACFAKGGFKNPQTVLATGNVIIESELAPEKLRPQIEELLVKAFDFAIEVCVISLENLRATVKNYPFTTIDDTYHRYVIFKTNKAIPPDFELDKSIEAVSPSEHIMYWYVQKGHTLDSPFAKHLAKVSKKEFSTTRNINTLNKIIQKADG